MKKILLGLLLAIISLTANAQIYGSSGCNAGTSNQIVYSLSGNCTSSTNLTFDPTNLLVAVGSGTGSSAGVQMGYSGTSGQGGIWPTGVVPTNNNYLLTYTGGNTFLGATGSTFIRSNSSAQGVFLTAAAFTPESDGGITAGSSIRRFSSAFLGSSTAITASAPAIDVVQTWNNVAVKFTGSVMNVINSASNGASLFADYQISGVSALSIRNDGVLTLGNGNTAIYGGDIQLRASGKLDWAPSTNAGANADTALARNAAGVVEVNNGTAGTFAALKLSTLTATAAAPTVSAGQIGFGGTTSATATAGASITIPALAQGYIVVNIAGTTGKIPFYNN